MIVGVAEGADVLVTVDVGNAVGEGPAVVARISPSGVGVNVGGVVSPVTAVCEASASEVWAITVGNCSSGINVGNATQSCPSAQLLSSSAPMMMIPQLTLLLSNRQEEPFAWKISGILGSILIDQFQ